MSAGQQMPLQVAQTSLPDRCLHTSQIPFSRLPACGTAGPLPRGQTSSCLVALDSHIGYIGYPNVTHQDRRSELGDRCAAGGLSVMRPPSPCQSPGDPEREPGLIDKAQGSVISTDCPSKSLGGLIGGCEGPDVVGLPQGTVAWPSTGVRPAGGILP